MVEVGRHRKDAGGRVRGFTNRMAPQADRMIPQQSRQCLSAAVAATSDGMRSIVPNLRSACHENVKACPNSDDAHYTLFPSPAPLEEAREIK